MAMNQLTISERFHLDLTASAEELQALLRENPDYFLTAEELLDSDREGERIYRFVVPAEQVEVRGGGIVLTADGRGKVRQKKESASGAEAGETEKPEAGATEAATPDAGTAKSETPDAGTAKSEMSDAGATEAAMPDAGTAKSETPDAGTAEPETPDTGTPEPDGKAGTAGADAGSGAESDSSSDAGSGAKFDSTSEAGSGSETGNGADSDSSADSNSSTDSGNGSESDSGAEAGSDAETRSGSETGNGAESKSAAEPAGTSEPAGETEEGIADIAVSLNGRTIARIKDTDVLHFHNLCDNYRITGLEAVLHGGPYRVAREEADGSVLEQSGNARWAAGLTVYRRVPRSGTVSGEERMDQAALGQILSALGAGAGVGAGVYGAGLAGNDAPAGRGMSSAGGASPLGANSAGQADQAGGGNDDASDDLSSAGGWIDTTYATETKEKDLSGRGMFFLLLAAVYAMCYICFSVPGWIPSISEGRSVFAVSGFTVYGLPGYVPGALMGLGLVFNVIAMFTAGGIFPMLAAICYGLVGLIAPSCLLFVLAPAVLSIFGGLRKKKGPMAARIILGIAAAGVVIFLAGQYFLGKTIFDPFRGNELTDLESVTSFRFQGWQGVDTGNSDSDEEINISESEMEEMYLEDSSEFYEENWEDESDWAYWEDESDWIIEYDYEDESDEDWWEDESDLEEEEMDALVSRDGIVWEDDEINIDEIDNRERSLQG